MSKYEAMRAAAVRRSHYLQAREAWELSVRNAFDAGALYAELEWATGVKRTQLRRIRLGQRLRDTRKA